MGYIRQAIVGQIRHTAESTPCFICLLNHEFGLYYCLQMPRTYTKKTDRVNIDEKVMKLAMKECLAKRLKVKEAARQYGVKRTTLQSRIKTLLKKKSLEEILMNDSGNESEDDSPKYNSKYTAKQVFTRYQEIELSDYIKKSSNLHYGLTYKQIRILAYEFANSIPNWRMPENWKKNKIAGVYLISTLS